MAVTGHSYSSSRFVATASHGREVPWGTGGENGVQARAADVGHHFGPLAPLLDRRGVTDIFVNGNGEVWADEGAGANRIRSLRIDAQSARELAIRLIALGGRHLDEANPCADVRLGNGIRVHAVLPPIARSGTLLSIRVPTLHWPCLDDLERQGMFLEVPRSVLSRQIAGRANFLITGAGGSGKTTLLAALLASAGPHERIVALEDIAELQIAHPQVVQLETRQPNLEGAGGIDLARLVREALRMRPDRLVVGECRGAEFRELLAALNTGHDGGAGTLHANGIEAVPARLEALGLLAGLSAEAVARQVVTAIDVVVHLERRPEGRRVVGLASLALDENGRLRMEEALARA